MLAPLFDRMTTHDLTRRFTADEALDFFQNEYSILREEQLNRPVTPDCGGSSFDYWDHMPPYLAEKWAHHRTPPVPLSYPVLRWLCKRRPMEHVVPWIRWLLFSLVTFPRRVLKSLQTSFCPLFLRILKSLQVIFWSNEAGFHFLCCRYIQGNICWMIMSCHQEVLLHSLT